MKAIVNANIIADQSILKNHSIVFDDRIIAVSEGQDLLTKQCSEVIDAEGKYLSAGFIDIHIHGCAGADTMDENDESLAVISRSLTATGVTAFLPTTMTMPEERIEQALKNIRNAMKKQAAGAEILGCHLEGPFINKNAKGAHDETFIAAPYYKLIESYGDVLKIVTLAPETAGSELFIKRCTESNIIISIGHTQATYEQAMEAVRRGARLFTHTFNAMPPLHHRHPGAAGAALDSEACCELIVDNIHVHPAVQRIVLKAKGTDRVILITDAMMACLMKEGVYNLGGQQVTVMDNAVRLANGHLAGSILTLNTAVKNIISNTGLDLPDAIRLVTQNPARMLGIDDRKGRIAAGMDADLTLFDGNMNIYETYVKGQLVYGR